MSEFFLSTDFGILLCVFFAGVGISGRLAAWVRAIHACLVSLRKRTLRYRLAEAEKRSIELERQVVQSFKDMRHDFMLLKTKVDWSSGDSELEDRVKVIEDWLTDKVGTEETDGIIKKKAKEREAAYKKID